MSMIKRVSQRQDRFHLWIPTGSDRSAHRVRSMENESALALRVATMLDNCDAGLARHYVADGITAADATGQLVIGETVF